MLAIGHAHANLKLSLGDLQKLRQRDVETENIAQSRRNKSPFSSGRRLSATYDEELGPEPQVRCWQTRAPGEPEDLIPVQSICPMQVPWSTHSPPYQSKKRPGSSKRHGKKKMPRLEGQTMVPGKRPRTGEKEQLEHSVVPFGAARRVVTVLSYEDSKTREEKLLEQLCPAAGTTSTDVSPALPYDIPSTSDWFTTTQGQTSPREIQVEKELPQENQTERRPQSSEGKDGTPKAAEPKKIPTEKTQALYEEKFNVAPTTVKGPFGVFWRPKSTLVVHQNALFDRDEKQQHDNALFEEEAAPSAGSVDKGPESSDKSQHPVAPKANKRRGWWRKFTPVHNVGETTQPEESAQPGEGKDREPSCKVELPSHTDVIVELLDDVPEVSECVQDRLKEVGGILIYVRDSERNIVSWDYHESEDPQKTQGVLEELEGFHIRVRDSERKEVSRGDDVSEKCVQESEVLRIYVSDSERRLVSRGDNVQHHYLHAQLKEVERPRTFPRDSEKSIVTRNDDVSELSVQDELAASEGFRVRVRDSERIVSTGDGMLERRVQAGFKEPIDLHIHVRDNENRMVSWGDDIKEDSVQGELKASEELHVHVNEFAGRLVSKGDDRWEGNVQEDLQESKELQIHVSECERRMVSKGANGQKEGVQEEVKESNDLHLRAKDSEKNSISSGDDISAQSTQKQLNKVSKGTRIQVRDSERSESNPSGDPDRHTKPDTEKEEDTKQDVHNKPRENNRRLQIVKEGAVEPLLPLKKEEEHRKPATSANDHFSEPKLSREISPILESVKQKKVKSVGEEGRKRGVSHYVFDPPKISRPKVGNRREPTPKPEQEGPEIVLEERGPQPKLEEKSIKNAANRIRSKSVEKTQANSEEKPKKNFINPPPKSREETQAELEEISLTNSLKEPLAGSLMELQRKSVEASISKLKERSRPTPVKGPQQTLVEEVQPKLIETTRVNPFKNLRPKLEQTLPRANPSKELQQKLMEEPQPKLEEKAAEASSSNELPRQSVEKPRPKPEYKTLHTSFSYQPQRKSKHEQPPQVSFSSEARSTYDHRSEFITASGNSSFQEARLKVKERAPRPKYVEEARPKSTYNHQSELVTTPQPTITRDARFKSVEETQPTLAKEPRPNSGDELRSKLVTAHRPKSVEQPLRETRTKSVEEPWPTLMREQRTKYVEEYRPKPIDEKSHELDTTETGESSTRKTRKRKAKPQKPD